MESIQKTVFDRVEVSGLALFGIYAALAFGMYLQYVRPA
jgi:hypothetical protein